MATELPIYRVKYTGTDKAPAWAVVRPDGSRANDCDYSSEKIAQKWLERMVAFGFCKTENEEK